MVQPQLLEIVFSSASELRNFTAQGPVIRVEVVGRWEELAIVKVACGLKQAFVLSVELVQLGEEILLNVLKLDLNVFDQVSDLFSDDSLMRIDIVFDLV